MKNIFFLFLLLSVFLFAAEQKKVEHKIYKSRYMDGTVYYSEIPTAATENKVQSMAWSNFAKKFTKSFVNYPNIGWVEVSTPAPPEEPDIKTLAFWNRIPPSSHRGGVIISPTISKESKKK